MCEFCHQHGEGKKWYLNAKNYADDLLADLSRRQFIAGFSKDTEHLKRSWRRLELFRRLPLFIRRALGGVISNWQKNSHFGQVLPLEDIEKIFGFVNSVTRLACICRSVTTGTEQRYCYGISLAPDGGELKKIIAGLDESFYTGPETAGLEPVSKDEALAQMAACEQAGMCHTVWTMRTPFIGGICNCSRADCLAMRATVDAALPVMFKAEYIAKVDRESCAGCTACLRVCQFGAISYNTAAATAVVDRDRCYGCGICRSVCVPGAITLDERSEW